MCISVCWTCIFFLRGFHADDVYAPENAWKWEASRNPSIQVGFRPRESNGTTERQNSASELPENRGLVAFFVWDFQFAEVDLDRGTIRTSASGILMMVGYVIVDSFTSNFEDRHFRRAEPSSGSFRCRKKAAAKTQKFRIVELIICSQEGRRTCLEQRPFTLKWDHAPPLPLASLHPVATSHRQHTSCEFFQVIRCQGSHGFNISITHLW